jgi:YfiH family protein
MESPSNINETPGQVPYLTFPGFGAGVRAVFTTRHGGVSSGVYASLNLGYNSGDDRSLVDANRRLLYQSLSLGEPQVSRMNQVHGDRVLVIRSTAALNGPEVPDADAQVTALPHVALLCLLADCQGIYLFDPVQRVIGVAHAGWRGTVAGIAGKCAGTMGSEFGSRASNLRAVLSPSAGPCCYEVGAEVQKAFRDRFPTSYCEMLRPSVENKWKLNLWQANIRILQEAGLARENITVSGLCTICRQDLFYSYRGSAGKTGRMAALLIID